MFKSELLMSYLKMNYNILKGLLQLIVLGDRVMFFKKKMLDSLGD